MSNYWNSIINTFQSLHKLLWQEFWLHVFIPFVPLLEKKIIQIFSFRIGVSTEYLCANCQQNLMMVVYLCLPWLTNLTEKLAFLHGVIYLVLLNYATSNNLNKYICYIFNSFVLGLMSSKSCLNTIIMHLTPNIFVYSLSHKRCINVKFTFILHLKIFSQL